MGREPRVDSRGLPVRAGLYKPVNRHGELQDISGDNVVSFADTFIGDLLGFDGAAGLQGNPGMMASIQGARRAMPQEEQASEPAGNAEDMPIDDPMSESLRPQARRTTPGDEVPRDADGNPLPVLPADGDTDSGDGGDGEGGDGSGLGAYAAAAAATGLTAAAIYAMVKRARQPGHTGRTAQQALAAYGLDVDGQVVADINTKPDSNVTVRNPGMDGEVLGPEELPPPDRNTPGSEVRTTTRGNDDVTVTANPPRTDNALPAPDRSDLPRDRSPAQVAPDGSITRPNLEDVPIDVTPEVQGNVLPDSANVVTQLPEGMTAFPDGSGGMAYRGNGQVFIPTADGRFVELSNQPAAIKRQILRAVKAALP